MLVRAVLAPQRADDSQLSECRRAAEHVHELLIFVGGEPVLGNERGGYDRIARASCNSHGVGLSLGGFTGMDGFTSFGGPGFICVFGFGADFTVSGFAGCAADFPRAAAR